MTTPFKRPPPQPVRSLGTYGDLKALSDWANTHAEDGAMPRTKRLPEGVEYQGSGMPVADFRLTTPGEVMSESAYGDFMPHVIDTVQNAPTPSGKPPAWADFRPTLNRPTYYFFGETDKPAMNMPRSDPSTPGLGIVQWPWHQSGKIPSFFRTLLHENNHAAMQFSDLKAGRKIPRAPKLQTLINNRLDSNQDYLNALTEPDRNRLELLLKNDAAQSSHVGEAAEYFDVLGELKRENWAATGRYPANGMQAKDFLDSIMDQGAPRLDGQAENKWDLWGGSGPGNRVDYDNPMPRNYGPMQGTRPQGLPALRMHIRENTPYKDADAMKWILNGLLHVAGEGKEVGNAA